MTGPFSAKTSLRRILTTVVPIAFLTPSTALGIPNTYSLDLEKDDLQYLSLNDSDIAPGTLDFSSAQNFTFEAWVKLETAVEDQSILSKHKVNGFTNEAYRFDINLDRSIVLTVSDGSTNSAHGSSTTALQLGNWHHVAVSYDASTGTCAYYLDGTADGTCSGYVTSINEHDFPFLIGAQSGPVDVSRFFDGKLDEVRVWNDIRTPSEIAGNRFKELDGSEANLVGYWSFNNDFLDQTSYNNDLTNQNGASFSTDVPFVPEPSTALLLAFGLAGLAAAGRRRSRHRSAFFLVLVTLTVSLAANLPASAAPFSFINIADSRTEFGLFDSGPVINDNGTVAFYAEKADAGTTEGVYQGDLAGSPVSSIAEDGDPAPGGGVFSGFAVTFGFPAINAGGRVTFHANTTGAGGEGIFRFDPPSGMTTIADGTDGVTFAPGTWSPPAISDTGMVAFAVPNTGGDKILMGDGGPPICVAGPCPVPPGG